MAYDSTREFDNIQPTVNTFDYSKYQQQYGDVPEWWAQQNWGSGQARLEGEGSKIGVGGDTAMSDSWAKRIQTGYGAPRSGYYNPDTDKFLSGYGKNMYREALAGLGDTPWASLSPEQQQQLEGMRYQDRHHVEGASIADYGVPIMAAALTGGLAATGAFGGAGAAAGGTTSSASSFPGLSVMGGGTGTGLGGTALTGTLGTGITAPTIGAGLSVGGSAIPALGAAGAAAGGNTLSNLIGNMAGMGWRDYAALGGDALDMYGQYQAGEAQEDAIRRAEAAQRAGAAYGTQAYAPYAAAGAEGLAGLRGMGQYDPTTDPQYQNQLAEMNRLMDARSAALGMSQSSADLKSRAAQGADLYGQAYGREYNRLGDLLNVGRYGTTGQVGAQMGQAQSLGNLALQGGNVQGNQLSQMYGAGGDLLAAPAQYQQTQQLLNVLSQNRGY
jgi:hypothetical protein